jgi:hypothetical protein
MTEEVNSNIINSKNFGTPSITTIKKKALKN